LPNDVASLSFHQRSLAVFWKEFLFNVLFIVFIYSLFNGAVIISDYRPIALGCRAVNDELGGMRKEGVVGVIPGPIPELIWRE
jgi:hypothetical protein